MIEGACLCRAVRITAEPRQAELSACHCEMCTRWTGSTQYGWDADPATVTVRGEVAEYRSSPFATRAWCPACGSALWLRDDGGDYEFVPGLFPATKDWPLDREIYADRAWAAMRLMGDHRRISRAEYEAGSPHVSPDGAEERP